MTLPARRSDGARWLVPALVAAIGLLALVSLGLGPARIPPWLALKALVSDEGSATIIVRDLRLPRALLAILIGANLGLTGAALQGLLRNPLADATVFGAPQAAALGAVLVLYFGLAGALSWALPVAAILGALASIALVVAVAGREAGTVGDGARRACDRQPRGGRPPRSPSACRQIPSPSPRSCSGSSARSRTARSCMSCSPRLSDRRPRLSC